MKRTLSLLLAVFLAVAMFVIPTTADNPKYTMDASWYVDHLDQSVYTITTPEQLLSVYSISRNFINGYTLTDDQMSFKGKTLLLGNDINLNGTWQVSDTLSYNVETGAITLGTAPQNVFDPFNTFAGTFDGQGHTISGLYGKKAYSGSIAWGGFIASVTGDATIRNVAFENSLVVIDITSNLNLGRGGLIGNVGSAKLTIENVYLDMDVYARQTTASTGMVGGFIGRNQSPSNAVNIYSSVYAGTIYVTNNGTSTSGAKVLNISQFIGGCNNGVLANVKNSVSMGTVYPAKAGKSGDADTYGEGRAVFVNVIEGAKPEGTDPDSAVRVSSANGTGGSYSPAASKDGYAKYEFLYSAKAGALVPVGIYAMLEEGKTTDAWYYSDPDANTFYIADKWDLYGLSRVAQTNTFAGKTIKLTADIDMAPGWDAKVTVNGSNAVTLPSAPASALIFRPIPTFSGMIDGQGHSISGIYGVGNDNATKGGFITMFTPVGNAGIRNLIYRNSYYFAGPVTGNTGASALIGAVNFPSLDSTANTLTLQNLYVDADFVYSGTAGMGIMGGVVGRFYDTARRWTVDEKTVYSTELNAVAFAGKVVAINNTTDKLPTGTVLDFSQIIGGGQYQGTAEPKIHAVNCAMLGSIHAGSAEKYGEAKVYFENLLETSLENVDALETNLRAPQAEAVGSNMPMTARDMETAAFVRSETLGRVVPAGVAYLYNHNVFAQAAAPAGDKFSVRLLSAVETLDWNRVGFLVTVEVDGTTYYNAKPYETQTVFVSVIAAGDTVKASDLSGCENCSHIYALVLANLPATGTVTVTVTPTRKTPAKTVLSDLPAVTFTFVNGAAA